LSRLLLACSENTHPEASHHLGGNPWSGYAQFRSDRLCVVNMSSQHFPKNQTVCSEQTSLAQK
jgi:hypothetical protein